MRLAISLALALVASPAAATTLAGAARVIDGDTLEISGKRVRLFGIDAPEASQRCYRGDAPWACGRAAAEQLSAFIGSDKVSCAGEETDTYGRLVAVCTVDGVDLNQTMVAQGWAVAFRRYSDVYVADESRARASKRGLWASNFVSPEEYRVAEREAAAPHPRAARVTTVAQTPASACLIKGNHSWRGEWIYHLPGMPYYNQTKAEQMFCTEAEAVAAGYRRSQAHW